MECGRERRGNRLFLSMGKKRSSKSHRAKCGSPCCPRFHWWNGNHKVWWKAFGDTSFSPALLTHPKLRQKLVHYFLHQLIELKNCIVAWCMRHGIGIQFLIEFNLDAGNKKMRNAAPVTMAAKRVFPLVREIDCHRIPMSLEKLAEKYRVLAGAGAVIDIAKTHIRALFAGIRLQRRPHGEVAVTIKQKPRSRHVGINFFVEGIMVLLDELTHLLFAWLRLIDRLAIPCRVNEDTLFALLVLTRDIIRRTVDNQKNTGVSVRCNVNIRHCKNFVGVEIAIPQEILL